jgi:hypothetical protein
VPKTVSIWINELHEKCRYMTSIDSMALHALIEKVLSFLRACVR